MKRASDNFFSPPFHFHFPPKAPSPQALFVSSPPGTTQEGTDFVEQNRHMYTSICAAAALRQARRRPKRRHLMRHRTFACSNAITPTQDLDFMQRALTCAKCSLQHCDVPVGAIIVRHCDGMIVGEGHNQKEQHQSVTGHAELLAIQQANATMKSWRLHDCTMYVTLEPCLMCYAACSASRLDRIVYGAENQSLASKGMTPTRDAVKKLYFNHLPRFDFQETKECGIMLSKFFKALR